MNPLRMNNIRILNLSPERTRIPIECCLSIHGLGDLGEQEALSYSWGTMWNLSSSIKLHNQSTNVTPSLASALEVLGYYNKRGTCGSMPFASEWKTPKKRTFRFRSELLSMRGQRTSAFGWAKMMTTASGQSPLTFEFQDSTIATT